MKPSRDRILFGTDEPVAAVVTLSAGPLTAEFEDGNLRYIRFHGQEMLRAISYLIRDRNWGTCRPILSELTIESGGSSFSVRYRGRVADDGQALSYAACIDGRSDGLLTFSVDAIPETDFVTNRAGFVVLHPIEGVAGRHATVETADGGKSDTRFPDLIDPVQPMQNLRALRHEFAPGHFVACRMEGDAFEMEDQRNWLDASFKTYVRPLSRPWPYAIAKGVGFDQSISLEVAIDAGAPRLTTPFGASLTLPARRGGPEFPPLGFGLELRDAAATHAAASLLKAARPHHVVCLALPPACAVSELFAASAAVGAETWIEAVIGSVDDYRDELRALGAAVAASGVRATTAMFSPATDLKSTTPGQIWPAAPPAADFYREARKAFPQCRIGGGVFSYFTELNRKRPPVEGLDLVTFTTSSIVHACDDRSVVEGLEALPSMLRSARAFTSGKPLHVGPSAIGMRLNPYGAAPVDNRSGRRAAMARQDPRQSGLLGAAWALGYVAHLVREGVSAITLGGGVGDFGLLSEAIAGVRKLRPAFHVFRGVAGLAGQVRANTVVDPMRFVQALAAWTPAGLEIWLCNLTGEPLRLRFSEPLSGRIAVLDEASFSEAESDPLFMDRLAPFDGARVELLAYAVARLIAR